ncbi:MAG TPA: DUF72 domain-containing protein [Vicinamibacterales bacterium]
MEIKIGTAGWTIPRAVASQFDSAGTHLHRYAITLRCAEINSSFHRPHTAATYAKWRDSTPPDFRFAVKVPRTITHELKLRETREPLSAFLAQTDGLAEKRGPLLVQLPPSLIFDAAVAVSFLELLREVYPGAVVCEPRHATWFSPAADAALCRHKVARVAADPPPTTVAAVPAGWPHLAYFRWHGSPRKYWSRYGESDMVAFARAVRGVPAEEVWGIFDNTASGAAIENACDLNRRVAHERIV